MANQEFAVAGLSMPKGALLNGMRRRGQAPRRIARVFWKAEISQPIASAWGAHVRRHDPGPPIRLSAGPPGTFGPAHRYRI